MSELSIILALVLLNGVFSGAEIAILSVRRTRLAELSEAGSRAARTVLRLREQPEVFLATVQIGMTVVSATAAAFGGASLTAHLTPILARVPGVGRFAADLALAIVVGAVSFLSLVLGELVPKSLALRAGERYALLIGRPLAGLAWLARPLVALLTGASNLVLRLFGDRTTFTETRLSRDELQQIVEEAADAGSVDPRAGEIAARALELGNLDAYTLMVPRADIAMVARDADLATFAQAVRANGHGRLVVYGADPDDVVGVVNTRDALAEAVLAPAAWSLAPFLHPVVYVPDAMPGPAVLRKLQEERAHVALVLDEQGTIQGLVALQDLVEELVGEILGEDERPSAGITREATGSWLVAGSTPVHEVNRELGIELPEGDFSTVAGLVLSLAGRIPTAGDVLRTAGIDIEVTDASPRRVKTVRLRPTP